MERICQYTIDYDDDDDNYNNNNNNNNNKKRTGHFYSGGGGGGGGSHQYSRIFHASQKASCSSLRVQSGHEKGQPIGCVSFHGVT